MLPLLPVPEVVGHSSRRAACHTHTRQDVSAFRHGIEWVIWQKSRKKKKEKRSRRWKEEIQVKSCFGNNNAYWIRSHRCVYVSRCLSACCNSTEDSNASSSNLNPTHRRHCTHKYNYVEST